MDPPTTTIETVTVVRPLKVLALLCLVVAAILILVAVASTSWLRTGPFRQGLFEECLESGSEDYPNTMLPSQPPSPGSCAPVQNRNNNEYVRVVAALMVIAGVLTVATVITTSIGLASVNSSRKYLFYKFAMYIALLAVALEVASLVTFPVCFYLELKTLAIVKWDFDWAYGVGWGALVFTVGASILLICDKEHEEIYYKEKTIMHHQAGMEAEA